MTDSPGTSRPTATLRVLIVAESASATFGGEAALPLHYFRVLRARGFAVWLLTHARNRDELRSLFLGDPSLRFVDDTALNRFLWSLGRRMPPRLSHFTAGFVSRFATQLALRRAALALIDREQIQVVHQPMPVSPREPSSLYGLGVPVVIGPMNGGMSYPPAFTGRVGRLESLLISLGRTSATALNALIPGKRRAALLLVANRRTRDALPSGACSNVRELVENGVDLSLWRPASRADRSDPEPSTEFLYLGRLVDWKGVDLLIEGFGRACTRAPMRLVVAGDGEERDRLQAQARRRLGSDVDSSPNIKFTGWLSQEASAAAVAACDCLVLPSLLECGGAVVLEAMAMGKPVIATDWGGPRDYLDETCGILVAPSGKEAFVAGLCDAMVRMALRPEERVAMGARGRQRVAATYDWEVKVDRVVDLYRSVVRH